MSAPGHPAAPCRASSPRLPTPSQTAGPFVSLGTAWLADAGTVGETDPSAIVVAGSVLDGDERPVTDALAPLWWALPSHGAVLPGLSAAPMVATGW
jgi:protocatechuate 3,4-dioxygenase beta subunit